MTAGPAEAQESSQGSPKERSQLRPPGLALLLAPLLMRAPRGDGHPVLALPGFLASDLSMAPLRRYLAELGYDAQAWRMGRNIRGLTRMRAALRDRLAEI